MCVLHLGSVPVDFSKLVSDNETRTTHFPSPGRVRQKVNDSNALRNKEDFSSFAFVNDSSSSSLFGV